MSKKSLPETDGFIDGTPGDDHLQGTAGDDMINGLGGDDVLEGFGGVDLLAGGDGNDIISGGDGNDLVAGERGNDILYGGAGNDYLHGGDGSDIFLFGIGSGSDTIEAQDIDGGQDWLVLGAGITANNVSLRVSSNLDLILSINDTEDSVQINEHFYPYSAYAIQGILFADGTVWYEDDIVARLPGGTSGDDYLFGGSGDDVIRGWGGGDSLRGRAGNDTLDGGAGTDFLSGDAGDDTLLGGKAKDFLYGGTGKDILDGGAGNDLLRGGDGADIYVFGIGSGIDLVYDYSTLDGPNQIALSGEITIDNVTLVAKQRTLKLVIDDTGDILRIQDFFANADREFEIRFADGTVWDKDDAMAELSGPTEGGETLFGGAGDDVIDGLGGEDHIFGEAGLDKLAGGEGKDHLFGGLGNDTLVGGKGDDEAHGGEGEDLLQGGGNADRLYGQGGNDTLAGGTGQDYVSGGAGNDIYRFNLGDGQDTIAESGGLADRIVMGAGIDRADVTLSKQLTDLVISINGTDDQLTVNYYFSSRSFEIENILFADGLVWDLTLETFSALGLNHRADTTEAVFG